MSLELAAQHLASRGRKGDTMLVHMAPQEVSGLQALARAHGGTLTLNPDTGLPEANFLKRMLPMIIGAGLSVASGGTLTPLMAAMMTGGGYGLATGSLKKGLMAGLGAYGGAGLAGGLSAAGTAAAGEGLAGAVNPLAGAAAETGLTATGGVMGANPMLAQPMTFGAETLGANPMFAQPMTFGAETLGAQVAAPATPMPQTDFLSGMDRAALENKAVAGFNPTNTDAYTNAKRGLSGLMDNQASRDAFMAKMEGGTGLLKTGLMAAAPMLMGEQKSDPYTGGGPNPYEYSYDPNKQFYTRVAPGTRQRDFLAPTTSMMAMGGPVEDMSYQNRMDTMMANGGQMFAAGGGISHLGDYSDGGRLLRGPGGGDTNVNAFSDLTPAEQAAFYAANPTMSAITQAGQNALGMTSLGMALQGLNPIGFGEQAMIARGVDPATMGQLNAAIQANAEAAAAAQAANMSTMANAIAADNASISANVTNGGGDGGGDGGGGDGGGGAGAGAGNAMAKGGMFPGYAIGGGLGSLGSYSDGGRLLKGPGDGVSDSIPATIGRKQQPARLADGEFVVPARIVSELGNGSTEAGARKLYAMMDRIQKARGKTTGKNRVAVNSRTEKLLPA